MVCLQYARLRFMEAKQPMCRAISALRRSGLVISHTHHKSILLTHQSRMTSSSSKFYTLVPHQTFDYASYISDPRKKKQLVWIYHRASYQDYLARAAALIFSLSHLSPCKVHKNLCLLKPQQTISIARILDCKISDFSGKFPTYFELGGDCLPTPHNFRHWLLTP